MNFGIYKHSSPFHLAVTGDGRYPGMPLNFNLYGIKFNSQMKPIAALLVTLIALSCFSVLADGPVEPKHVDAQQAAKLLKENKDVVVLDIRTPDEFASGHIAGARNVDYLASDFGKKVAELDKSKTYLVHCAAGSRSTKSLSTFKKLSFPSIYHLDGGFNAWEKAGNPVAH